MSRSREIVDVEVGCVPFRGGWSLWQEVTQPKAGSTAILSRPAWPVKTPEIYFSGGRHQFAADREGFARQSGPSGRATRFASESFLTLSSLFREKSRQNLPAFRRQDAWDNLATVIQPGVIQ